MTTSIRIAASIGIVAIAAACAPDVQITGAVQFGAECAPTAKSPLLFQPLLDIGTNAATSHDYVAALTVTTYSNGVITFDSVDSFFTTDGDAFANKKLPTTETNAARASIGGTSANEIVFAPAITTAEAIEMQNDTSLTKQINAGEEPVVVVHLRLNGANEGGGAVSSQFFPLPIALCAQCLTFPPTNCGHEPNGSPIEPVVNPEACVAGDDKPSFVCPAP